jgi:hypothetical protein
MKDAGVDWTIFWFREVLFLSVPVLLAVFTLPRGDHIHTARLEVLLAILLGLTLLNVVWASVRNIATAGHLKDRISGWRQ